MAIALLLISTGILHAQKIRWQVLDSPESFEEKVELPSFVPDSTEGDWLMQLIGRIQLEGFLTAAASTPEMTDSVMNISLHIGPQYAWAQLSRGNVPDVILSQAGYRPQNFTEAPLRLPEMQKLFGQIITYSENNGYPFAAVWLDSLVLEGADVSASMYYDPGPEILFDSLVLEGFDGVKEAWLMSYLDIRPGKPFNQQAIDRIPARIQRLPFLRLQDDMRLTFQNEVATLYLPAALVKANRIDGVVGFLPNEENDGGLRITGQLDLSLTNLFGSGKELEISWQRVKPLSQTLLLGYRHRNLFHSPLHLDGSFQLLKEDSTFVNRFFRFGLTLTTGIHEIGFVTRFKSTRLLSTSIYENVTELPEFSDQNINFYGVEYLSGNLSSDWGGNRGWSLRGMTAIGDKRIRRNNALPAEVYEGLDLQTLQFTLALQAVAGIPLGKRSLLYQRVTGGWVHDDQLFLNDLFRIGGLRSLRGFNENNFFASEYATVTVEYQVFFEANSYVFLFIDQGFMRNGVGASSRRDNPTGVGAGFNLRTTGGNLQLAFALGRTRDQDFNFSLSKFHFGYIANF